MMLLNCRDASFAYDGNTVVTGVTFDINSGDYLCIVGENGSGKSTLAKALLGLIKPVSGEITYAEGVTKKDFGYLPQTTAVQRDFPATVYETVLSGTIGSMGFVPFYTAKQKETCRQSMETLGITDIAKKSFQELSGGQQQRVLLARALCAAKKMLVLDEPVTGLDPIVTADFYKTVKDLNSEQGITVVMVSHDISRAVTDATKILHLHREPLFFGTKEDYLLSDAGRLFAEN